jgi:hypothetical protein
MCWPYCELCAVGSLDEPLSAEVNPKNDAALNDPKLEGGYFSQHLASLRQAGEGVTAPQEDGSTDFSSCMHRKKQPGGAQRCRASTMS